MLILCTSQDLFPKGTVPPELVNIWILWHVNLHLITQECVEYSYWNRQYLLCWRGRTYLLPQQVQRQMRLCCNTTYNFNEVQCCQVNGIFVGYVYLHAQSQENLGGKRNPGWGDPDAFTVLISAVKECLLPQSDSKTVQSMEEAISIYIFKKYIHIGLIPNEWL